MRAMKQTVRFVAECLTLLLVFAAAQPVAGQVNRLTPMQTVVLCMMKAQADYQNCPTGENWYDEAVCSIQYEAASETCWNPAG